MRRAACLLLLTACSKGSSRPAEPAEPSVADPFLAPLASPAPSAPALSPEASSNVRLLDRGQEPLRPLRYAWRADQKELMDIELRTALTADAAGTNKDFALPPVHVAVAIEPRSVSPEGDLRFAWHVESATVQTQDAAAADTMTQGWKAQLVPVEHLSGSAVVSPQGISKGVELDPGTAGDAGPDAQMVVTVLELLRSDAVAPLPGEPVGKGARWQKLTTLDTKNGHATQTDTYTLLAAPGDTGTLDDVFAQTVSPQALPSPVGMSSVSPARVDSLLMSGTAKERFDLSRLVAQTTREGTTSMALSASGGHMNMVMRLGVTVRGTIR